MFFAYAEKKFIDGRDYYNNLNRRVSFNLLDFIGTQYFCFFDSQLLYIASPSPERRFYDILPVLCNSGLYIYREMMAYRYTDLIKDEINKPGL